MRNFCVNIFATVGTGQYVYGSLIDPGKTNNLTAIWVVGHTTRLIRQFPWEPEVLFPPEDLNAFAQPCFQPVG